jgi:Macrocin-O-methyltransferase (TylF)
MEMKNQRAVAAERTARGRPALRLASSAPVGEREQREELMAMLRETPIPDGELFDNLGLYQTRQALSRILFIAELYREIIDVHGVIMEFGVRWGQNMSLFGSLRGIYEPFNYSRKVIGFDSFSGFPATTRQDGSGVSVGDYGVAQDYENHLDRVLEIQAAMSPLPHIRKYELVKGDAVSTVNQYIERNPHTIVALAYFDFDIYGPTKACIEAIMPRMVKGGILAFDELNCAAFPGETLAVLDTIGLGRFRLRRSPLAPLCSYMRIE